MAQRIAVAHQPVEEHIVPFGIDETRARALQLVAHAAGAPHLHIQVLRKARHRAGNRLAQRPAAVARGRRIGNDIDRQRNDPARPLLGRAKHHRQGHGKPVVDIQFVDDGHVEFVKDQALGNVPCQIRVAFDIRHRSWAPAFIANAKPLATTDGKGGDQAHVEIGGVVVIDQNDHIGLAGRFPLAGPVIAAKDRAKIIVVRFALIHRHAQQGHMAGADTGGNAGHVSAPLWRNWSRPDWP